MYIDSDCDYLSLSTRLIPYSISYSVTTVPSIMYRVRHCGGLRSSPYLVSPLAIAFFLGAVLEVIRGSCILTAGTSSSSPSFNFGLGTTDHFKTLAAGVSNGVVPESLRLTSAAVLPSTSEAGFGLGVAACSASCSPVESEVQGESGIIW